MLDYLKSRLFPGKSEKIDADYVRNSIGALAKNTDLSRFIL